MVASDGFFADHVRVDVSVGKIVLVSDFPEDGRALIGRVVPNGPVSWVVAKTEVI